MALNFLLHENVGVPCTHDFGDCTITTPEARGQAADELTGKFLKELGWEVKREKDKPMSQVFTALGVDFDLSDAILTESPHFVVRNKVTRIEEICRSIDNHLDRRSMSSAEATELRGRLIFSNSQTYGRMGALAYFQLGLKAKEDGPFLRIRPELREALLWWKRQISNCKPRIIRTGPQRPPVYLFTDGSCDPDGSSPFGIKAAYGAVMYDPEDQVVETF